jgi:hypothetical protein
MSDGVDRRSGARRQSPFEDKEAGEVRLKGKGERLKEEYLITDYLDPPIRGLIINWDGSN